jgi:hypothetical protein
MPVAAPIPASVSLDMSIKGVPSELSRGLTTEEARQLGRRN